MAVLLVACDIDEHCRVRRSVGMNRVGFAVPPIPARPLLARWKAAAGRVHVDSKQPTDGGAVEGGAVLEDLPRPGWLPVELQQVTG
jgi:hypothetical protein